MMQRTHFQVDPKLASLLGENYRSSEYALKELIDNAWDADATSVSIRLPNPLTSDPLIIQDNGTGMTERELTQEYLVIASSRFTRKGDRTPLKNRMVKGRKGIGKFAGLLAANVMEIETSARGKTTRLRIIKEDLLKSSDDLVCRPGDLRAKSLELLQD
jgi:HSP90 family molecular chaperone